MSPLEIIGTVFGFINIVLLIRRSAWFEAAPGVQELVPGPQSLFEFPLNWRASSCDVLRIDSLIAPKSLPEP